MLAVAAAFAALIWAIFCALSSLLRARSCAFSSLLSGVDGLDGDGESVCKECDFWTLMWLSVGALLVVLARFSAGDGAPNPGLAMLPVLVGFIG